MMVIDTSMTDFGSKSSRTLGANACWIRLAIDLSSASCEMMKEGHEGHCMHLTRIGTLRTRDENGVNLTSTLNFPIS